MIDDPKRYRPSHPRLEGNGQSRRLRVQVVRDVLWYAGAKAEPLTLVLVRDPSGAWRDSVLVATDPTVTAAFVIQGYCRRWSIEVDRAEAIRHAIGAAKAADVVLIAGKGHETYQESQGVRTEFSDAAHAAAALSAWIAA